MTDRVAAWLAKIGLVQYVAAFKENELDWELLPDLDQQTLKDVGIRAAGHRLRILKAISELNSNRVATGSESDVSVHSSSGLGEHDPAAWERQPGERKPVTMLFADIVGSTSLTEQMDAEEAHEFLYGATQRMCEAVERQRGTVCRFMGDGVMAMFGAPIASEHHAVDACEAAVGMQQAVREYAGQLGSEAQRGLQLRVGLHSGEVVVLTVGDEGKVEYDASGPTVPIAARMEQMAEPGTINMTSATRVLAGPRIQATAYAALQVKGIKSPVEVFRLQGVRPVEELTTEDARTPFVGRRAELNQFRGIFDTCLDEGQGQAVYVRGEPGIGKTRLVSEFAHIASDAGARIKRGLVLPFGVGKGQDAIRSLVRHLLDIAPGSGRTARQRAVDSALERGWIDTERLAFLNDLLDLPPTTDQLGFYDAMDNAARNAGKRVVVSKLLSAASIDKPILAVVEDVHWADEGTLAQLAALAKTVADCRALLVMTSRIDGDQLDRQWLTRIEGSPFVTIDLGPLRKQDSIALIGEFMETIGPVADQCLERAAGNPLFLEQLLRTASESSATELPDSIQSLVLARIDRLDPEDKRAIQAASVLGQRFDITLLNRLLKREAYDVETLVEHNLVRPEAAGYLFGHALIQEGVYGSLLKSQRVELHRAAAHWFAERDKALHAQHLDKAGDAHAATAYLEAASEQADQYRYEEALRLIARGLEVVISAAERHELTCFKGQIFLDLGDVEASMNSYRESEAHAENNVALFDAWMGQAACQRMTTDYQEALELLDKCELLGLDHTPLRRSRLHHLRGNVYFPLGNVKGCLEAHQKALRFAREANSAEAEALALGGLGDAEFVNGRMKSAFDALSLCVERSRERGFGRIEVANLSQMADAQFFLVDAERALKDSLDAVEAAQRVSHERAEMNALAAVCNAAFELWNVDRHAASAERGLAIARRLGARSWEPFWYANLLLTDYLRGTGAKADHLLSAGTTGGSRSFVGGWILGAISLTTDDPYIRSQALTAGDSLESEGTMGEGVLWFYRLAIETCLEHQEWSRAIEYANALEGYTRPEPLPWSDFFVVRGRLLSAFAQGDRSRPIRDGLERLRADGQNLNFKLAMPAVDCTLG